MRAQAAKSDDIVIARSDNDANKKIIGALRLCPVENSWLLRSMCIDESYQRQGIGLYMLNKIREQLSSKQCYCFPYQHLETFYASAGFQLIDASTATPEIQALFSQYCEQGKSISLTQFSQD